MDKYIILSIRWEHKMQEAVNEKIKEGYLPLGGLCYNSSQMIFYQAMLLVEALQQ